MRVSVPLDNDGYFFAEPHTVGTTDEEVEAAARHQITEERATEIARIALSAMTDLRDAEPAGRC